MSGGSFEYLCDREPEELLTQTHMLEAMRDRLVELGYSDAARETEEARLAILQIRVRMEAVRNRMRDVWKAVEWHQSCDWGIDRVEDAIRAYRTGKA